MATAKRFDAPYQTEKQNQHDFNIFSTTDMDNLFANPMDLGNNLLQTETGATKRRTSYFDLSVPGEHRRCFQTDAEGQDANSKAMLSRRRLPSVESGPAPTYDGFVHSGDLDLQDSKIQAAFTYQNPRSRELPPQPTIAPLQTCADAAQPTITPLHTYGDPSLNGVSPTFTPANRAKTYNSHSPSVFTSTPASASPPPSPATTMTSQSMDHAPPHKCQRRRTSSIAAEPGSARAIYLEKNRRAASKCRGKQKVQQEDLIETARTVEQKNKVLKAEVELLRSDMRNLMGVVGNHVHCPDERLRLYVDNRAEMLVKPFAAANGK
ncbi:hypothetical protein P280DRAFT_553731 [Massarina eburnea CBS 473.64]|uniref:BZIP domain-containing protein n=1 Tax=Massarina eburnea CBS 473.64 TaxID=1395130 RepID=A0A6A6RLV9_9PLEO|nr:hypothetical protein P280DRAFT_553731 [Massarina eburnea CBS 473.64]